ncbi:MAG TPA: helix-turn-helix transcriptional regulator [Vicinamibacterales bacterium]|nr:helix-turn-helix transcriptional regulator [Vicinamibacterales bacterium]
MQRGEGLSPEKGDATYRALLGGAVRRARLRAGWSLKEFAGLLKRNERQIGRWETGDERALWDLLFALPRYRQELIIALAEVDGDNIEVRTTVTIKGVGK